MNQTGWTAVDPREEKDLLLLESRGATVDELRDDLGALVDFGMEALRALPDGRFPLMKDELMRIARRHGPFEERVRRQFRDSPQTGPDLAESLTSPKFRPRDPGVFELGDRVRAKNGTTTGIVVEKTGDDPVKMVAIVLDVPDGFLERVRANDYEVVRRVVK